MSINSIETRVATIFKDENDIIHIKMFLFVMVDEEDIIDINLVIRNLSGNAPALKLLNAKGHWNMTEGAKKLAAKQYQIENTIARAVITDNHFKSALSNFIQRFNFKSAPQQFFTNEDNAYEWLMSFKGSR